MSTLLDKPPTIRKNDDPMNVVFAVLADAANVSQEGKLNILGNFANINAKTFPVRHPQMQMVIRMEASPVEVGQNKKMEVVIVDEDGKKISGFGADLKIPPPKKSGERVHMLVIMGLRDTVFPKKGKYAIGVLINGNEEATVPLTVGGG